MIKGSKDNIYQSIKILTRTKLNNDIQYYFKIFLVVKYKVCSKLLIIGINKNNRPPFLKNKLLKYNIIIVRKLSFQNYCELSSQCFQIKIIFTDKREKSFFVEVLQSGTIFPSFLSRKHQKKDFLVFDRIKARIKDLISRK